jgi:hypothetical protein
LRDSHASKETPAGIKGDKFLAQIGFFFHIIKYVWMQYMRKEI